MCGQAHPREPMNFRTPIPHDVEPKYPPILASSFQLDMAASCVMQSLLVSPVTRISNRSRVNQLGFPATSMPTLRRNVSLRVRSMAEPEEEMKKEATSPVTPPKSGPQPVSSPSPKKKQVSTKFSDVLAFNGPAPERINGRLAMIGFVAAIAVEAAKGQDVFSQIADGGIPWFLGTSVVLTVASLVPLFKGVSVESKSQSFMSSDAELWNGRFAMLGLVALAFTEYVIGGTLV